RSDLGNADLAAFCHFATVCYKCCYSSEPPFCDSLLQMLLQFGHSGAQFGFATSASCGPLCVVDLDAGNQPTPFGMHVVCLDQESCLQPCRDDLSRLAR